jgi:DNA polymerase I
LFPEIEEMHTNPKYLAKWIEYSCFDAEITFFLRETLSRTLCRLPTEEEGLEDNLSLYAKYWLPFGELLTDMERVGISVDVDYLRKMQLTAIKDKEEHEDKFLQWV